jgi:microcystin-dependent protein
VECTLGSILLNVSTEYPSNYLPADGRLLPISEDTALFSLIGINYGGDGTSNFALPNLKSAAPDNTQYLICAFGVFP